MVRKGKDRSTKSETHTKSDRGSKSDQTTHTKSRSRGSLTGSAEDDPEEVY